QMAVLADEKDLALVSRYVPGTPTYISGDHGRLRQILVNLVGNALKFTPKGHVLVTVEHKFHAEGPPWFTIAVQDTGIGIVEEDQATVFDLFQQADMSTTKTHAGTGLGLTIVRELVSLMGGQVDLVSDLGRGSTFSFSIPLDIAHRTTTSSGAEDRLEPGLEGQRVLVVDDQQISRFVVRELLERWGLRPTECRSGAEALAMLRQANLQSMPFGLALIDYHMPAMSGLELSRHIHEDPALRGVVVVMMSSVTRQLTAEALQNAGCYGYLVKPMHQSDLMDAIVSAWDQRNAGTPPSFGSDPSNPVIRPREFGDGEVRVLVVEDNVINQKVAQRMLIDLGCRVDLANNGTEALELIELVSYAVVFMDIQMPLLDGLQATAAIRTREQGGNRHLPIVAMTAHAMPADRQRCLDAGMDGYISKPVRRRDLLRAVREYAALRSGLASPPVRSSSMPGPLDLDIPCDLQWLRDNYDTDQEVLRSLVEMFVDRAATLIAQMQAAIEADDMDTLGRSAHALKGISGTVRANQLFVLMSEEPAELVESMDRIERAFATLRTFFAQELGIGAQATRPSA
ncbi:MAG: response regulator, partial [Myxococcota bacterium]